MRRVNGDKPQAIIFKFGGSSATTMEGTNKDYIRSFFSALKMDLPKLYDRIILVIGGGPRIRALQETVEGDSAKNLIAREALWEHAQALLEVSKEFGWDVTPVVPHSAEEAEKMIASKKDGVMAMSWLRDGQSTDASAVLAARGLQEAGYGVTMVMLSNINRIFTADPKKDPQAKPISVTSVPLLVNEGVFIDDPKAFKPGMHIALDPVAVSLLNGYGDTAPTIFFCHGADTKNTHAYLTGETFHDGTLLDPQQKKTRYGEK